MGGKAGAPQRLADDCRDGAPLPRPAPGRPEPWRRCCGWPPAGVARHRHAGLGPSERHAGGRPGASAAPGPRAETASAQLGTLIATAPLRHGRRRQARAVNQFFNRQVVFAPTTVAWGQARLLGQPAGDAGQGAGRLRGLRHRQVLQPARRWACRWPGCGWSTCVRSSTAARSQAHMVLAYYAQPQRRAADPGQPDRPRSVPARAAPDLMPVFSFNSEGLWQGVGRRSAGDPTARLSRWREVLAKARAEGFL